MKYCIFVIDDLTGKIKTTLVTDSQNVYMDFRYTIRNHYFIQSTKIDKSDICHTIEYRVLT